MQEFFQTTQGIFTILIILGIGYCLSRFGWIKKAESEFLTRFVVYITLPPYMVVNITTNFTRDSLLSLVKAIPVPFLSMFLSYLLATVLGRYLKIPTSRRGVFLVAFSFSNTIFVGLPVCQILFGESVTPFILLYYMVNTTFFWTLGALSIASSGNIYDDERFSLGKTIKRLCNPPFVAFFIGLVLVLFECPLPQIIFTTGMKIGNITTPLSLLCVGTTVDFKKIRLTKDLILVLLGRFIISPLFVLLVAELFPPPALVKEVFVVMSAMPVMMQASILARFYRADYEYATSMIAASTALSALIIPLLKMGIQRL
ncbi:MAG: AEC family transporter [Atribacterota bacterium]